MSPTLLKISTIIGYIAIAETLLIYVSTKRQNILALKLVSDVLWLLNHLFCGAITGGVLNGIGIVREVVFTLKGRYKIFHHAVWPVLFVAVSMVSTFLSWEGALSLLPMTGTAIIIPALYSSNLLVTKLGAIAGQSFWLVYDILHSNTTAIICGVIAILSGFVGLIAEYIQRKKLQKLSAQSAAKKA